MGLYNTFFFFVSKDSSPVSEAGRVALRSHVRGQGPLIVPKCFYVAIDLNFVLLQGPWVEGPAQGLESLGKAFSAAQRQLLKQPFRLAYGFSP